MMWQDAVFLVGSTMSVLFLYPTLRDRAARVPRATSLPSMIIGGAYAITFFTLDMRFSALGAFAACTMWSLIALFRGPESSLVSGHFSTLGRWRSSIAGSLRRTGESLQRAAGDAGSSPAGDGFEDGVAGDPE